MFKKRENKKRGGFIPFVIFRLLLSLSMFLILALGAYQAFKYFSGVDPIKIDPKTFLVSLLASKNLPQTFSKIFGFEIPQNPILDQLQKDNKPQTIVTNTPNTPSANSKLVFKFAVVADSHADTENLNKALGQSKTEGAKFVIGLGDYSEVGTMAELKKAKEIFLTSGLPLYLTAGDHDLWDSRDKGLAAASNFSEVFGSTYQSFIDSNIRFVLVFNSDNYDGVDPLQIQWLKEKLTSSDKPLTTFVFLHEPLYHPSSDRVMGSPQKNDDKSKSNQAILGQAQELISILKEAGVKEVFAGDIHAFSRYEDPKSGLKMTTVGALTGTPNTQAPRFVMVDVYDDGSYNIKDTELK